MLCTLIVAMFLLGSCTVEYRARHGHSDGEHHSDMNHDNHNNDRH
jgi:hypothetical protein